VTTIPWRTILGRTVSQAWGLLPWPERSELARAAGSGEPAERDHVLRHGPSGHVLSDGSDDQRPVRFASRAAAGQFRTRFLDEADAWEALPAEDVEVRAA
jgi:uncharacterized iron-regulated membrane protein